MEQSVGTQFTGKPGQTQVQTTTVWCGQCGVHFGAQWYQSLDAEADPASLEALLKQGFAALNSMQCPRCAWLHVAEEPLTVHLPSAEQLYVVVPEGLRHRVEQTRAALIQQIAADPGEILPDYARNPIAVVGAAGLAAALARPEEAAPAQRPVISEPHPRLATADARPAPLGRPLPPVPRKSAPAPAPKISPPKPPEERPTPWAAPSIAPQSLLDPREDTQETTHARIKSPFAQGEGAPAPSRTRSSSRADWVMLRSERGSQPKAAPKPFAAERAPGPPSAGETPTPRPQTGRTPAPIFSDLEQAWGGAEPVALQEEAAAPSSEDVTHVVAVDQLRAPREGYAHFAWQADASVGMSLDRGGVYLGVRLEEARYEAFEGDLTTSIYFQLHRPSQGPAANLVMTRELDAQVQDHVLWLFDFDEPEHEALLEHLQERFSVEVQFFDLAGVPLGRRVFRRPLEANVREAKAVLAQASAQARSFALATVASSGYDLFGQLRHNFAEDSFKELSDAAQTQLALGILSYWSVAERREYLLFTRSFPLTWFEQLSARVLKAALHFGLWMEPHLRARALALGLAEDVQALVTLSLSNFALVTLGLRSSGLDVFDTWENWDKLLILAQAQNLRVKEDVERVALQAMERAREASEAEEAAPAEDEAPVALDGGFGVNFALDEGRETIDLDLDLHELGPAEPQLSAARAQGVDFEEQGADSLDESGADSLDESGAESLDESGADSLDESGAESLEESGVDLDESGVDLEESGVDLGESGVDLDESGADLDESGADLDESGAESLDESGADSLDESGAESLEESGVDLDESGVDLEESGVDLEESEDALEVSGEALGGGALDLEEVEVNFEEIEEVEVNFEEIEEAQAQIDGGADEVEVDFEALEEVEAQSGEEADEVEIQLDEGADEVEVNFEEIEEVEAQSGEGADEVEIQLDGGADEVEVNFDEIEVELEEVEVEIDEEIELILEEIGESEERPARAAAPVGPPPLPPGYMASGTAREPSAPSAGGARAEAASGADADDEARTEERKKRGSSPKGRRRGRKS